MLTGVILWGGLLLFMLFLGFLGIFIPKFFDRFIFKKKVEKSLYGNHLEGKFRFVFVIGTIFFGVIFIYNLVDYCKVNYSVDIETAKNDFSVYESEICNIADNSSIHFVKKEYDDNEDFYEETLQFEENGGSYEIKLTYNKWQKHKSISVGYNCGGGDRNKLKSCINVDFVGEVFNKYAIVGLKERDINSLFDNYNSEELIFSEEDNTYEYSYLLDVGFKSELYLIFPPDMSEVSFSANGIAKK